MLVQLLAPGQGGSRTTDQDGCVRPLRARCLDGCLLNFRWTMVVFGATNDGWMSSNANANANVNAFLIAVANVQ